MKIPARPDARRSAGASRAPAQRLCPPDPDALADAVLELADSPELRRQLAHAGHTAVRERTWERALERLAAGYRRALGEDTGEAVARRTRTTARPASVRTVA